MFGFAFVLPLTSLKIFNITEKRFMLPLYHTKKQGACNEIAMFFIGKARNRDELMDTLVTGKDFLKPDGGIIHDGEKVICHSCGMSLGPMSLRLGEDWNAVGGEK